MHAAPPEHPAEPDLYTGLARLMEAVLGSLAVSEGAPAFADQFDVRGWNRFGQREFGARRRGAWLMPAAVTRLGWLDRFPAMEPVRTLISVDPVLSQRVGCLVGVEFSLQARPLEGLIISELLEPMVRRLRAYRFELEAFNEAYSRLETGLRATHVRVVEFLPLNALRVTNDVQRVSLDGDLVLEAMTDGQISDAIAKGAVPAEFAGGPLFVSVDPEHQWALKRTLSYPIVSSAELPETPAASDVSALLEPGQRLVTALRIVCGGSAVVTRPILRQHDNDFPLLAGGSAALSALPAVDLVRPTLLTGNHLDDLCAVYHRLGTPFVTEDVLLQRALRRLVFAGAHHHPEDRLADLMTCSEIIFIKRRGFDRTRTKKEWIVVGAPDLLRDDPVVAAEPDRIGALMSAAYEVRNFRMHGDDPATGVFVRLDGSATSELAAMVDDVDTVVRRCLHLTVEGKAPSPELDAPQRSAHEAASARRTGRARRRRRRSTAPEDGPRP